MSKKKFEIQFDENGDFLGLKRNGAKKEPKYICWKEEPYEQHRFSSTEPLKVFIGCGVEKLEEMLTSNMVWNGWQCEELI